MTPRTLKKTAISVLALGLASAAVIFGSFAAWSAHTTNPSNTVSSGTLTMTNSKNGFTVWSTPFTDIKPGEDGSDTVTLTNTGSAALSEVDLTQSNVVDDVSDTQNQLQIQIEDSTLGHVYCVYPASASACGTNYAAWDGSATIDGLAVKGNTGTNDWAVGEAHTYTVGWKFNDLGSIDNDSQGQDASFDLAWDGLQ
jgi:hypothetical protein